MIVNHKLEVDRQIELILQELMQFLGIHLVPTHAVVQPAANTDLEAVCGLVKEDAPAGN